MPHRIASQAVTNFWEHGRSKELADGKRLMDAAKSAGTKKVYWSGLMPVQKLSGGKYTKVEHFDTKVRPILPASDRKSEIAGSWNTLADYYHHLTSNLTFSYVVP